MTKKTKPCVELSFTNGIYFVLSAFLFVLLLKNSTLASIEVAKALKLCANMLIPSIFPLTVASEILTSSGAIERITKRISAPISKFFGVSRAASVPYLLGVFGGYTSSCKSAVILYQEGRITKGDCESVIALSNMPSIAFLTGFVGAGIFQSSKIGWALWIITVLSTVILGIINKFLFKNDTTYQITACQKASPKRFSKTVVEAIAHSAQAMLTICACVVFFSVLSAVMRICISSFPIGDDFKNFVLGMLEITNGISNCASIEGITLRASVCSFLIGWSGLCVHFQVISLCDGVNVSYRKYFILKVIQGIICMLLTRLFFTLTVRA